MSLWKMIAFWVVALVALTALFMTPAAESASTPVIVSVVMAVAITFVLITYRHRPRT